jgi:hypothetical protein
MMADSIEHVISYWVIFQKFHSPALGGVAVVSHWLPFLLFSVHAGALADRFDPRRIIQIGMLLFMCVSLSWGVLFATDTLQVWHATVLLIIHGIAGVLWNPPSQLLIHDIVEPEQLPSAVRLNATARYLGLLAGPAVGAAILHAFGPAHGIFLNAFIYTPAIIWLWKAPYGPRFRKGKPAPVLAIRGFADIISTIRIISKQRTIASMTLLSGGAAFFIGNAYQAQMPGFATALGHGNASADFFYSILLAADAAGALTAAILLESGGFLRANPRTAIALAAAWCCALGGFALSTFYPLAIALLFMAGLVELSFNSMAQTLVQINADPAIRGRTIGVYSMAALGLRTFSGISVGLLGGLIGIHASLAFSALALLIIIGVLFNLVGKPNT